MPDPTPTRKMRAKPDADGVNSAPMMRSCVSSKNAAPTPAVAMPIDPHSRLTLRNLRHGSP
jgi:hypothetical protein